MTPNWIFLCLMFCAFKVCSAATNLNCTFESGFCGWQNRNNGQLMWHIWNSTSPLGRTALPFKDHSLNNSSGHFAFIRGTEAKDPSWTASLISPPMTMTSEGTMSFWYYMRGHGVGMLRVYLLQSNGTSITVLKIDGRQGRQWKQAKIKLLIGQYQIVIEATTRRHYDSDLAIDDVTIIKDFAEISTTIRPSTTPKSIPLPIICDFDSDMCGFTIPPSSYSPVTWQRTKQPGIENGNVYIKGDNTTGNGFYMSLLEHVSGGMAGDKSEILSPVISTLQPSCLTMAYSLPSSQSGTISIYQVSLYNKTWELLKEISGYRGHGWKSVQVDISTSKLFQIVIEGSYAGTKRSFVGVDDLRIEHGNCIKPTLPPITSSMLTSCNFTSQSEILSLSCTFEDDLCHYQTDVEGVKWKQMEGAYGAGIFSRITSDHTSQNDPKAKESYAILDVDDYSAPFNSGGDLTSTTLNDTVCIEFWYQIFGYGGNLDVMIESKNGLRKSIWKSSSLNKKWTMVALRVESTSTFKIVFHSVKLKTDGYVAIDDVSGYNVWPETTTTKDAVTSDMSSLDAVTSDMSSLDAVTSDMSSLDAVTSDMSSLTTTRTNTNHTTAGMTTSGKSSQGEVSISTKSSSSEMLTTKSSAVVKVTATVSNLFTPTISSTLKTNTKNDNSNKDTSEDNTTTVVISVVVSLVALTIILVVVYRLYKRYLPFTNRGSSCVELKTVNKYNNNNDSTVHTSMYSVKQDSVSNTKFTINSSNGNLRSVT